MESKQAAVCDNCSAAPSAVMHRGHALCDQCFESIVPSWDRRRPVVTTSPPADTATAELQVATTRHPWHRWFARVWLDYAFAGLVVALVLNNFSPGNPLLSNNFGLTWISALLWIPAEALLVSTFGTTPGKYLVGMRVQRLDGRQLSLSESFSRSVSAWAVGCAMVIPVALFFTFNAQYNRLRKGEESSWDEKGGFVVVHSPLTTSRRVLVTLVGAGILSLFVLGRVASVKHP
jgi:uncharacterized RDD family membrane protein YckC